MSKLVKFKQPTPGNKLYITVSEVTFEKFKDLASRYRLTLSQLGNICIMAGMEAFTRSVSPGDAISPDLLADLVISLDKKGYPINLENMEKKVDEK